VVAAAGGSVLDAMLHLGVIAPAAIVASLATNAVQILRAREEALTKIQNSPNAPYIYLRDAKKIVSGMSRQRSPETPRG
jgi:hypothetical protein